VTTVPVDAAEAAAARTLREHGVASDRADRVASVLVDADRRGHASHGLALLPTYAERIRRGGIDPAAAPEVVDTCRPVTLIDARDGLGPVAAWAAAERCAADAAALGLAAVAVRRNNHVGMLAAYRAPFAEHRVVGLITTVSGPSVSTPGTVRPVMGNDALCVIAPREGGDPLVVDLAMGVVACGKVRAAGSRGEPVPAGWLLDAHGRPSADPADLDRGGSVPIFGGHKGVCIAVIVEVMAGMLGGGTVSPLVGRQRERPAEPTGCSQLFVGFALPAFGAPDIAELSTLLRNVVAADAATGFPEDAEQAAWAASASGIDLPDALIEWLDVGVVA
jgi:LDH2 family malate/lactate/ureidoglycolate dehydrogenase